MHQRSKGRQQYVKRLKRSILVIVNCICLKILFPYISFHKTRTFSVLPIVVVQLLSYFFSKCWAPQHICRLISEHSYDTGSLAFLSLKAEVSSNSFLLPYIVTNISISHHVAYMLQVRLNVTAFLSLKAESSCCTCVTAFNSSICNISQEVGARTF